VDEKPLLYEYTVDDPTIFTSSFTVSVPMRRNAEPMFEYACHEGNYGLLNILRGARRRLGERRRPVGPVGDDVRLAPVPFTASAARAVRS